jgi:alpha-D-xyloside xylohydrolase
VLSALTVTLFPVKLAAQQQTFSSSAEYRSMLEELHHDPVRPSRIGAGTLLSTAQPPADLQVQDTAASLRIETALWRLEITKGHWGMALANKETGLTWQLAGAPNSPAGIAWTQTSGNSSTLPLANIDRIDRHGDRWQMQVEVPGANAPATLEVAVLSPRVLCLSIRAPHSVNNSNLETNFTGAGPFFGLGERFDRVKLDGLKTLLRSNDLSGQPGHNWTYLPVPLLFTPRGLGMYLDTAEVSTVDLTHAEQQTFSVQLQTHSVDAYFFVGSPGAILENYTALTGRSPVPPPWTFGVWICSYRGPQTVLATARRLRQEKIPASAIWTFDVMGKGDIQGWPLWWTGYYPNPRQFTDDLHAMGFKALTYVHPYLRSVLDPYNLPNPFYVQGQPTGLMVLNAQGQPTGPRFEPFVVGNIDFTSAANVKWWGQKVREIVFDDNFDGWMEDFGEWVDDTDRFAAGVTGRKMANLNPLFYHKITYEISQAAKPGAAGSRADKPDIVEFDRSGYAGSQAYTPVIWGGDQQPNWSQDYGLPSVVRAGITAGLVGFPVWGPDIDGNGFSLELWTRWVEFGALTPVMRTHDWDMPEGAVDLWSSQQTIHTFRRYAGLHISLFPYLYTYAHQAAKTGMPILRHPLLEFPDDPLAYDTDQEYLLGDKILVAPVTEQGATSRTFYLPHGSWTDYWTGNMIDGGRQVTVRAPLDQIPLLVRAGSILPMISPDTETLASDLSGGKYRTNDRTLNGDLIWRLFPASAPVQDSFTLYDGTVARASQKPLQVEVHVEQSPLVRGYEVILPAARAPRRVLLDGNSLAEITNEGKSGWRMDADSHTLHVKFWARNFDLNVDK